MLVMAMCRFADYRGYDVYTLQLGYPLENMYKCTSAMKCHQMATMIHIMGLEVSLSHTAILTVILTVYL